MVMLQMLPGKVRQFRSRTFTQPSFGSLIRPDDWPVRSTFNDTGSGKRKLSAAPSCAVAALAHGLPTSCDRLSRGRARPAVTDGSARPAANRLRRVAV